MVATLPTSKALDMMKLPQIAPASMAGVALMIAPMADGNFPNPEDPAPPAGNVVAQLPAPYQSQIDGACGVASIHCVEPNLDSGLGYTIELPALRIRMLEGTQINSGLNVEVVLEVREEAAAYGVVELLPVCTVVDEQGQAESWSLNGTGGTYAWSGLEPGTVIDDEYILLDTGAECDPMLERRDILAVASFAPEPGLLDGTYVNGWVPSDTATFGSGTRARVTFDGSAPTYGQTSAFSFRYALDICGGVVLANRASCVSAAVGTTSPITYRVYRTNGTQAASGSGAAWFDGGSLGGVYIPVSSVSVTSPGFGRLEFLNGANLLGTYYPVGHTSRPPDLEAFTASSLTAYDVFASIIFRPLAEGAYMMNVTGICDGFDNCINKCTSLWGELASFPSLPSEIMNHLGYVAGQLVACYLVPDTDFHEWWRAIYLEVSRSTFAVDMQTMGTYLFSPMRTIGSMGRTCGSVELIPSGNNLVFASGYSLDTCTLYEDNPQLVAIVWGALVAMAWFGGALAIVRIFQGALGIADPLNGKDKKDA